MQGHFPKKRFGQNFLVDEYIIDQIVSSIDPAPGDHLIEIGPGMGAITVPLLSRLTKMEVIELDRDIIPLLKKNTAGRGDLTIHAQDALKLDLSLLTKEPRSIRVVGNLPYNISTPLLFLLFEQKEWIRDMHFMLQKEVAERLTALPHSKKFGRLTVMAQYHCDIESLIFVPPHAFNPAPKVDSLFIRLKPVERNWVVKNRQKLDEVVKLAFAQRRKTIHNSLKSLLSKEQFEQLGINPNCRPEELGVQSFVTLSNFLSND